MNDHEKKLIADLQARGYAVAIYSPDDLMGADPDEMELCLADAGADFLKDYLPPDDGPSKPKIDSYTQRCLDAGVPPFGPIP